VTLYLLAAMLLGTLASIAITAVISSLLWHLLNEFALRRFVSMDARELTRWLLVIGVCAGVFLVISVLAQGWVLQRNYSAEEGVHRDEKLKGVFDCRLEKQKIFTTESQVK
jgi:hypothetical protein